MNSEPLDINNKTFMVNRLIQQAPTSTLVREFFKNCEESAARAIEGSRHIRIYPTLINGVRKLTFWNAGPGMDAAQLRAATDLSSSINKEMSLDGNFGIGAKVSGLAASPAGLRYRSCKDGIATEVTIGWDEDAGTYVRFAAMLPDGSFETVFDVTSIVEHPVSTDWTEVVLLGAGDDHDTVSFPLGPHKAVDRSYIPSAIFRRFARFAPGVEVKIDTAMTKGGGKNETGRFRSLRPLEEVLDRVARYEDVFDGGSGVKIRYVHDPKHETGHTSSARANPATSSTTFCALVHKNERYDNKSRKTWSAAAPTFGIPFGSKVLTIEIELPDDMAMPSQYRDTLAWPADRELMTAEQFAALVRDLMPDWVRDVIRAESPQRDDQLDDLKEDLQRVLDEFRLPKQTLQPSSSSDALPTESAELGFREPESSDVDVNDDLTPVLDLIEKRGGRRESDKKVRLAPSGATASALARALERAPDIEILDREEDIADKGIQGRAGKFYKDIQMVYINGLYSAVDRMASDLERDLAAMDHDPDVLRSLVLKASQRWTAFRVGKAICFALAKRIADGWSIADMDTATTPESLSLAADDYRQSLPAARRWVLEQLKVSQLSEAA